MNEMNVGNQPGWQRIVRMGLLSSVMLAGGITTAVGCLDRPIERVEPRTTTTIVERLTQSTVDKIDLLLMIDNSRSMADKQQILQLAVPDLIQELVNPRCGTIDPETGNFVPAEPALQPAGPTDACPGEGHERDFEPVLNIHVGIITSSLGGHGADACDAVAIPSENDHGHLTYRVDTEGGGNVPTYLDLGFLAWDPCADDPDCAPKHDPPGEADVNNFIANLTAMVQGTGEIGCGYEASLESWYRFLIDPDPYESIELQDTNPDPEKSSINAVLLGTDNTLLQQRKDFMRPDSLLAIIMLSDENDCSIRDGGQFYFVAQIYQPGSTTPYHLPKPQISCATDPQGSCCRSCGQSAADGCPPKGDECAGALDPANDQINLRCFDQKRRFGIDFLQPISRYVDGLTKATVPDRNGDLVQNPIFTDLNPDDEYENVRDPGLVFLAGIVGVPWHDIARKDSNGNPDLLSGLNSDGNPVGGFQNATEMAINHTWDIILGEPSGYINCSEGAGTCPSDPLMIESFLPRSGTHPITGESIGLYPTQNSVNGHEFSIPQQNDLQYACIFPLQSMRDCSNPTQIACDCLDEANDNPLCGNAPGVFGTDQYRAKAYPGIRELSAIREVGEQGIVGSICPAQQEDNTAADFGYRPAIGAIVERLKVALRGQCLPRSLTPNDDNQVSCLIIEAKLVEDPLTMCTCTGNGRNPIKPENQPAVAAIMPDDPTHEDYGRWNCFCEITQTAGDDLTACQNNVDEPVLNISGGAVHGWCYIDATTVPPTGNPAIVATCPANEQRIIRFVGDGQGAPGATLFITCTGE